MSTIEFKDLNKSIGTELFADTESFLEDLGDDAANILGGKSVIGQTAFTTTHYQGPETTLYRPIDHNPDIRYSTIILHKPHIPRHPRPIHPVRYPRPIHPVFAASDM